MPAEAVAGLAEALVPLVTALCELVFVAAQLAAAILEILFHLIVFLIRAVVHLVTRKPQHHSESLSEKIRTTMEKKFGGHHATEEETQSPVEPSDSPGKVTIWNPFSRQPTPPFEWKRWHTIALGIWLGLLAAVMIFVWWIWGKCFDVMISEAEVQQAVAQRFPKSKTVLRVVETSLRNPVVRLDEQADKITATIDCVVKIAGVPGEAVGNVVASGRLEYGPQDGAFYLKDVHIDRIELGRIPERWEKPARESASFVVRETLERLPVYKLKEDRWKEQAARLVLRKVRVENGVLVLTMGIG
jgi:hypothetical protein